MNDLMKAQEYNLKIHKYEYDEVRNRFVQDYITKGKDGIEPVVQSMQSLLKKQRDETQTTFGLSTTRDDQGNLNRVAVTNGDLFQNGKVVEPRIWFSRPVLFELNDKRDNVPAANDLDRMAMRYHNMLKPGEAWHNFDIDKIFVGIARSLPKDQAKELLQTAEKRLDNYSAAHEGDGPKHCYHHRIKTTFDDLNGDGKPDELRMFQSCSQPKLSPLFSWYMNSSDRINITYEGHPFRYEDGRPTPEPNRLPAVPEGKSIYDQIMKPDKKEI